MPMASSAVLQADQQHLGHPTILTPIARSPLPQDVPFNQLLSYGSNGSPTITITKTLFTAAETTSTKTPSSISDTTLTSTTTGTSTVFSTVTITSTVVTSTPSSTSSSLISTTGSDLTTSADASTTTPGRPQTATGTSLKDSNSDLSKTHGMVAGTVIGSMAAFGMVGFLMWYLCAKKQGSKRLKAKIKFRRRKSSVPKALHLEGQSMDQTRAIMLQRQAEVNIIRERELNAFLTTSVDHVKANNHTHHRENSRAEDLTSRPSVTAVAVSSGSSPSAPPHQRLAFQEGSEERQCFGTSINHPAELPASLLPGLGPRNLQNCSTLIPAPLKPVSRPAPIITKSYSNRAHIVSPLSPRNMLNAVGSNTSKVWRRASQVVSPSVYQRLSPSSDRPQEGLPTSKNFSKLRNPKLEIGTQTDKGWNEH